MPWGIVVQPNKKYARFSTIVDDFTHMNMSRDEAYEVCRIDLGIQDARARIERAEAEPDRWEESLSTVEIIHGVARRKEVERKAMLMEESET